MNKKSVWKYYFEENLRKEYENSKNEQLGEILSGTIFQKYLQNFSEIVWQK